MALTRKLLKGMGLTEEQIDSVIDAHTETVDALKTQIKTLETDAGKLTSVQKELDELKSGTDWKAELDKEHAAFEAYKAEIASKETLNAKQAAFRKLLTDENIPAKFHDRIVKMTDFDSIEMDGDAIKDEQKQRGSIQAEWGDFIATTSSNGDKPETPPKNDTNTFDSMDLSEKMKYANENPNAPEVVAWLNN